MPTRTGSLALLLLVGACSPAPAAPDAGHIIDAARGDADLADGAASVPPARQASDAPLAAPRTPTSDAPATSARLAAIAIAIGVADTHALGNASGAAEPPAVLLRHASVGVRRDGVGPRLVRSRDGRDLWAVSGRGTSHWTTHIHLTAPTPAGTHILPVYDLPQEDVGFALVDDATHVALLLPAWEGASPFVVEAAAQGATLADTIELRWMKSCPTSRSECLLFGTPEAVAAAVDPVEPPGGWFMHTSVGRVPAARALPDDASAIGVGVQIGTVSEATQDDDESLCGVWATFGGAPVEVLEFPCYEESGYVGGAEVVGDRRVVWAWEVQTARVHVAQLDLRTGAPRAAPLTATADSYYEIDCANVFASVRPLPVLGGAQLGFAIAQSGREALYFADGEERGRFIRAQFPSDPFDTDDGVEALPGVLRVARCHGRACLRPAR